MRYLALLLIALSSACTGGDHADRSFQQTGIVEGFYGPPWSHQDRLDVLRFMGRVGLTHYYYAPKDDPYHRDRWREQYPADDLAHLRELATVARESGVTFVYAISPGGSMVYADSGEYATLKRKLDEIGALGVTAFAIFLDDVPPTLEHEADRAAFHSVAQAHASVINHLSRDLAAEGATLAVTPTTYTDAWGDRDYLRELGELVVPEVPFFWTGVDVQAPEITAEQARVWGELMSREPLIWDNYPVNDFARWRPFLGPLQRRGPDLPTATLGILSNPMNEAHASMIPLSTLAEYVRDPRSYDPDGAERRALVDLYGEDGADAVTPFVQTYYDDGWHPNLFEPLIVPGEVIEVEAIGGGLARLDSSLVQLETLAEQRSEIQELVDELRPFVEQTRSRLEQLESDPLYEMHGDTLVYRAELDRKAVAAGTAPQIDGDIAEWSSDTWYDLHGPDDARAPRVAFRYDSAFVYAAIRVPYAPQTVLGGTRIGEGDHVALVVQHDADASRTRITPDDAVVLVSPPSSGTASEMLVRSIDMGTFTSTWVAPRPNLTLAEFFVSSFGTEPADVASFRAAGTRVASGYAVEVAIPRDGRDTVRLSLTVTATVGGERQSFSLAERNYPADPAAYAVLLMNAESAR